MVHKVFGLDWLFLTVKERIKKRELAAYKIGRCIDDLQKLGEQNGFKTMVIIQPVQEDLFENSTEQNYIKNVIPMNSSVMTFDMIDFFKTNNVGFHIDDFYWPINRHFTKKGNILFALGLEEQLIKSQLLE